MIANLYVCYYASGFTSMSLAMRSWRVFSKAVLALALSAAPALASQSPGGVQTPSPALAFRLKHADSLARQGAFSAARDELKDLLKTYPKDVEVRLSAARFYRTIGLAGPALEEYKRAIELGCRSSEPFVAVAQMYLANLDNKQALEYANRALSIEPNSKQARAVLVAAQLNQGKLKEAQTELAKVLVNNNAANDADLAYLAYRLNRERGQLPYAKQFLEDAIRAKPEQTRWLLDRADLYQSLGDENSNSTQKMRNYVEAKRTLLRFLEMEPRSVEGLNKLGTILEFYFHDYDGAKQQYEKILSIDPEYVAAITGLDRCKAKKNDLAGQMKLEFWKTLTQPFNQLRDGLAPRRGLD